MSAGTKKKLIWVVGMLIFAGFMVGSILNIQTALKTGVAYAAGDSCYNCHYNKQTNCWECLSGYSSGGTSCTVSCDGCTVTGHCEIIIV